MSFILLVKHGILLEQLAMLEEMNRQMVNGPGKKAMIKRINKIKSELKEFKDV